MGDEEKDKWLSKHERRLLKHQERGEEKIKEIQSQKPKKKKGSKFLKYIIVILIATTVFQFLFPAPKPETAAENITATSTPATGWESLSRPALGDNWTADYNIYLCGEKQEALPKSADIGIYTLGDGKIIIKPNKPEETGQNANMGRFFDGVGKKFSETELLDKKNGDTCSDGKPANVTLVVNGHENSQFRSYVPRDGDRIEFRFE